GGGGAAASGGAGGRGGGGGRGCGGPGDRQARRRRAARAGRRRLGADPRRRGPGGDVPPGARARGAGDGRHPHARRRRGGDAGRRPPPQPRAGLRPGVRRVDARPGRGRHGVAGGERPRRARAAVAALGPVGRGARVDGRAPGDGGDPGAFAGGRVTRARAAGLGVGAVLAAAFLWNLVSVVRGCDRLRPVTEGDVAPEIALARIDGGPAATLSSLRGRVVIVDFWATWCMPCRKSMPALERLYRARRAAGLEIMSVNVEGPPAAGRAR